MASDDEAEKGSTLPSVGDDDTGVLFLWKYMRRRAHRCVRLARRRLTREGGLVFPLKRRQRKSKSKRKDETRRRWTERMGHPDEKQDRGHHHILVQITVHTWLAHILWWATRWASEH